MLAGPRAAVVRQGGGGGPRPWQVWSIEKVGQKSALPAASLDADTASKVEIRAMACGGLLETGVEHCVARSRACPATSSLRRGGCGACNAKAAHDETEQRPGQRSAHEGSHSHSLGIDHDATASGGQGLLAQGASSVRAVGKCQRSRVRPKSEGCHHECPTSPPPLCRAMHGFSTRRSSVFSSSAAKREVTHIL